MTSTVPRHTTETLSALDTVFLHLEDAQAALHIGAVAVFDGPAPSSGELAARYHEVVADCPRYRQVLRRAHFDLVRPHWVDVGEVDLEHHLRWMALPGPGSAVLLDRLVGRIMSNRLDPNRPLWEAVVVEGLEGGRWALVVRVHHCVVDGLGGMALFDRLLDHVPTSVRPLVQRTPRPAPSRVEQVIAVVRTPRSAIRTVWRTADGVFRYARSLRPTSANSLIGPLGKARRYRTLSLDLADVRIVRDGLGGTVNDVVLAVVTRGFRDLLLRRGELPEPHAVRCLVPVATRSAEQAAAGANSITALLVDLPVEIDDAGATYLEVRARMDALKASGEAASGGHGFAAADLLPEPVVAAALGAIRRVPQRVLTTVATNVPGPTRTQRLLGRRMVALYPYVPIAERMRIGVAVTSYAGALRFGVTCDRASVPDADIFIAALAAALSDLVEAVKAVEER